MDLFTRDKFAELLRERGGLCLSLFMPTRPGGSEQEPIRWRGLLREAEEALGGRGMSATDVAQFLRPARGVMEGGSFGKNLGHGLAYFQASELRRLYRLPQPVEERAAVSLHFLVTPLLPVVTGNGRFHVLALSQKGVRLLEATRDTARAVELPGVPRDIEEALATHDVDEPLTYHTRPTSGGGWGAIFHGHGVGIDDHKDDLLRYFRQVDQGIRRALRGARSPLVLAAVDYLQPIYREASEYADLLPEGIPGSPDRLSEQELLRRAWPLVETTFRRERDEKLALYRQLNGTGRTGSGPEELVPAAHRGAVETLFVPTDRHRWGVFDPSSGRVECHPTEGRGDEELLNAAAVHTMRHGGTVIPLPAADLPGGDLAGIYWLPRAKHR